MHKAELILESVKAALTGLETTGSGVERDRVYPPDQCPALSVGQGEEEPIDGRENMAFQDSILFVEIVIQIKTGSPGTQLNQIKAEIYQAIMANRQLGLSFVFDTQWQGDSRPEPSGDAETKTNRCTMRFAVAYRHSLTSKES